MVCNPVASRIVRTGGDFSVDRESLQWICIKGIPPKG
ncbi:fimbria/pilus periplasmic chaperone [Escherichia coli]|nr:fimbria/pilus periplasmic chaperone [Escherichia coli]MDO2495886.1 fimbria/pilus periplasmic chaperone [Escherichia coli]